MVLQPTGGAPECERVQQVLSHPDDVEERSDALCHEAIP